MTAERGRTSGLAAPLCESLREDGQDPVQHARVSPTRREPLVLKAAVTWQPARLSRRDRASDYNARLQISSGLGHARLAVTDTYLGSRFAAKAAD